MEAILRPPEKIIDSLPTLSVVVPFEEGETAVLDCIQSILDLDYPRDRIELIVVDDSHDDELASSIREQFPDVFLVRNVTPLGSDGSKQAGVEIAGGDVIAITDVCCKVHPSWARTIMSKLALGIGVVSSKGFPHFHS